MGYITRFLIGLLLVMNSVLIAEFELPYEMRELRDHELHHLASHLQEGPSCGWYATLNAYAIQEVHKSNQPLTDENIQAYVANVGLPCVRTHEWQIVRAINRPLFEVINTYQQDYLARFLGLTNYYIVELEYNSSVRCFYQGQWRSYACIDLLLREVKMNPAPAVHILLAVPAYSFDQLHSRDRKLHAVLISRIRRRAPKPFLLYMDSNNILLNPWSHKVVQQSHLGGLYTSSYLTSWYNGPPDYAAVREHVGHVIKTLDTL